MIKVVNGADVNLTFGDTSLIEGWSICFWSFSLLISKTKTLLKKRTVEAAKRNLLSSCCVKIHLRKIRSQRCRLQNLDFLQMLFLENEAQIAKSKYRTMLFRSKQVSLPKLA